MRIALVGLAYPFRGGISHYNTALFRSLSQDRQVRFFALRKQYPRVLFPGKTQLDSSATAFRVECDRCLTPLNPLSWWATYRRIRDFGPDFVLFSWWHPFFSPAFGTVAWLARRFGGIGSCFLCHNVLPHERSTIDRLLLRFALRKGRAFICHSRGDCEDLARLVPGARVFHNPHPSYDLFAEGDSPGAAAAKAELGLTGKRVVLYFGFIRKYKGFGCLLDAMQQLPPEQGYHLLVAGEFYEDRARYEQQLTRLREQGQLTLIDRYVPNEEVSRCFAASDLVVAAYLNATQSGVVQIAYSFGKPVVVTSVGGLPEVVEEGRTGYVVPPGDAAALSAAIRKAFEEGAAETFTEAIEQQRDRFSWSRMVRTVEQAGEFIAGE